ncbi:MAG TPA: rod shape-determining protein RodA [Coxiellaceae bacterium]|nr:rod shape-determining protein RodA [Coxiellaceae bacterium]
MKNWFVNFKYFDLLIASSSTLLLLLGLIMIYSTKLDRGSAMLIRQITAVVLGMVGLFALAFFVYRNLKKITPWLYLLMIGALVYVLFFGAVIRGSARWIDFGFYQLQPAELAKLVVVIIMAKLIDQHGEKLKDFKYVVLSGIYVLIPMGLILVEPDLGSALVVFGTWFGMLVFSPMRKKHLAVLVVLFIIAAVLAWFFMLHDYQKERVHTFINPMSDPQGSGYNVLQSIIAVGSGGWWGHGVGRGLQSQLDFLPERQTDFIFASTAEELGMLGSLIILSLFAVLFTRLIKTAAAARDNFGMYLTLGVFFMLLIQVLINIGMNIGILPVTGIPLPLLSYGGSSMLTTLLALGLVQSVVARQKVLKFGF